jgi:chemotaxis protein methyltransferase CheR
VSAPVASGPALSAEQFALFQRFIHDEAGIYLSDAKQSLLVSRLGRRLRELGLSSFGDYYRLATSSARGEIVHLLDAISTNETSFFREPKQFELLAQRILPAWAAEAAAGRRPRRLRVWSAACSTGEEPFSVAMALRDGLGPAWDLQILASDLSTRALAQARGALWAIEQARDIPQAYLKTFMLRGTGPAVGQMRAGPAIRSLIRFERVNLNDERWPVGGPFDMIFCRNVLIYFDAAGRRRTVHRLLERLVPGGYLFLGHAEGLHELASEVRMVVPSVYHNAPERRRKRREPVGAGAA